VSEQILNDTSAQLGYTVPFTPVHAGKYGTEDKLSSSDKFKFTTKFLSLFKRQTQNFLIQHSSTANRLHAL